MFSMGKYFVLREHKSFSLGCKKINAKKIAKYTKLLYRDHPIYSKINSTFSPFLILFLKTTRNWTGVMCLNSTYFAYNRYSQTRFSYGGPTIVYSRFFFWCLRPGNVKGIDGLLMFMA